MSKIRKTLVLNKAYLPINVIPWYDSITSWFLGKSEIIKTYNNEFLRSGVNVKQKQQLVMEIPSIIYMHRSRIDPRAMVKTLPFSRVNLFNRDNGQCIYCKKNLSVNNFTIEHVIPRANGGLTDWFNCRVACSPCNLLKGCKTLEQMGWSAPSEVAIPTLNKKVPKTIINEIGGRVPDEAWRDYIYWEFSNVKEE